jgi:hypothetical protein
MKDSEFKELLNLYLDHEISAADAARLEAEVQGNPSRRRLYQDYCRMQKACKMLAQDFAGVPDGEPERKVIAFDPNRGAPGRTHKTLYFASTFAAAAAVVALVFVQRQHQAPAATAPESVVQAAPAPKSAVAKPPAELVATTTPTMLGGRRADDLTLRAQPTNAFTLKGSIQNDPHFAWMQQVQLTPLQMPSADQLRLEITPAQRSENRTYTSGNRTVSPDVTNTAIRFQR